MTTGLRRIAYWRNRSWGWSAKHIWLYTDGMTWLVYARVGTSDQPRKQWKRSFSDQEEARTVIEEMMSRAEAAGDSWSQF